MNIAYGALALIISFAISKYFSNYQVSNTKIFVFTFVAEFIAIVLLGTVFYLFGWGFFSGPLSRAEIALKVLGFAAFLALLVAMKATNQKSING